MLIGAVRSIHLSRQRRMVTGLACMNALRYYVFAAIRCVKVGRW